jgi:hypothetical protein
MREVNNAVLVNVVLIGVCGTEQRRCVTDGGGEWWQY